MAEKRGLPVLQAIPVGIRPELVETSRPEGAGLPVPMKTDVSVGFGSVFLVSG